MGRTPNRLNNRMVNGQAPAHRRTNKLHAFISVASSLTNGLFSRALKRASLAVPNPFPRRAAFLTVVYKTLAAKDVLVPDKVCPAQFRQLSVDFDVVIPPSRFLGLYLI